MNKEWLLLADGPFLWGSLAACGLLLVLLLWLELRKKRPNSWLRILLNALALVALLLLALRPAVLQPLPPGLAVLLTPNAQANELDSLLSAHEGIEVFSLEQQTIGQYLPHSSYLPEKLAPGSTLFVLGDGPPLGTSTSLSAYDLRFLGGAPLEGIYDLSFPARVVLGDTFKLQGKWREPKDSLKVKLSLGGDLLDSAWLSPGKPSFQLEHVPKLATDLHLLLQVEDLRSDTLEQAELLVEAVAPEPLRIALLSGYPSYESNYLKSWLAERGHALFYQAEMAPDRFRREWLNLPDQSLNGLNKRTLREVDLLVIDLAYLEGLSGEQQEMLIAAVEKGLGLLIFANGSPLSRNTAIGKYLPPLRLHNRISADSKGSRGEVAGVSLPLYGADAPEWYRVPFNAEQALMLYHPLGVGTVGISLAEETYPMLLKDKEQAYQAIWSRMMRPLVRPSAPVKRLQAAFPGIVGQRQQLLVWQEGKEPPQLVLTEPNGLEQVLPLIQDSRIPERWFAYHWPASSGIYSLLQPGKDSLLFRVLDASALPAIQQRMQKEQMESFLRKQPSFTREKEENRSKRQPEAVPPVWLYLVFLLSMGGLWLEQKLNAP